MNRFLRLNELHLGQIAIIAIALISSIFNDLSAQTKTTVGKFSYEIDEANGSATVVGLKSTTSKVTDPTIPDSISYDGKSYCVVSIKEDAFANAFYTDYAGRMLSGQLTLPTHLKEIGKYAFKDCSNLTGDLIIPATVTSIGASAFENCTGLNGRLVLSDSIRSIGSSAFKKCSSLKGSLEIAQGVSVIEMSCFSECGFDGELKLPEGLTLINSSAFYGCKFSGEIKLPNSITEIGSYAFSYATFGNDTLSIPESCTKIGSNAFEAAASFKTLILPASLTYIDVYAFYGMTLNTVICKATTPPGMGYNFAFTSETRKGTLKVPEESVDDYKTAYYDWQYWSNIEPLDIEPTSITLNHTHLDLAVGNQIELKAEVAPQAIEASAIVWESSDNAVATVANGLVEALMAGTTTITAKTPNGLTATCQISVWKLGDSNGDGKIDASDLVNINNYILGRPTLSFIAAAADMNNDGKIDNADAMMVAQLILSGGKVKRINMLRKEMSTNNEPQPTEADKIILRHHDRNASIYLTNEKYSAIQFELYMPAGVNISESKLGASASETHMLMTSPIESSENATRFLIFSSTNDEFKSTELPILELSFDNNITSDITLEGILAVKSDGSSSILDYDNDWTAGIDEITADTFSIETMTDGLVIKNATGQQAEVYNIDGRIVFKSVIGSDNQFIDLHQGIYVVSIGRSVKKVIIN